MEWLKMFLLRFTGKIVGAVVSLLLSFGLILPPDAGAELSASLAGFLFVILAALVDFLMGKIGINFGTRAELEAAEPPKAA